MITFKLSPNSGMPFYRQLIDQIRLGIASGEIKIGDQLPTVRALAVELQINFHTVNKAYKELEWQNMVTTQQGTGTFITSAGADIPASERQNKLEALANDFMSTAASYGFTTEDVIKQISLLRTKK